MTNNEVYQVEEDLRKVEGMLEEIGRRICSVPGSGVSWSAINASLEDIRDAIHGVYLMRA